jgi:tripeptide aminopeptidase
VSTHTGTAKDVLVNALQLMASFLKALPEYTRTPETTSGRAGFIHPYDLTGTSASARLSLILRDFELDGLAAHGEFLRTLCDALQQSEPRARISVEITPQYRNMRYWLETDMRPVELAEAAYRESGIEPVYTPIRGGTDGSQLTERGLPTPNLFTGMQNPHGPMEFIGLQDMSKATDVCLQIVRLIGSGGLA